MISIIIPALNEERFLARLLGSIKAQSFTDHEVIVADAGSSDRTRQVARKYNAKVVEGGFPARGRNSGAKAAKGDVLLFIDADALLDKDYLENAAREMQKRNLDIAGSLIYPIGEHPLDVVLFSIFNIWSSATQFFYPNASGCGIFCKKSIHKKIGGFDEKIRLSEDMDYVRRAGKLGKFRILQTAGVDVSMRRFEKEGRLKVGLKLLLSAVYRLIFGEIKSDVFKYNLRYRK
jgi:glycosyltransferase involved in cell wall biosynthesis